MSHFTISELLKRYPKILAECAVYEPLSRISGVNLHPTLFTSPLIYKNHPNHDDLKGVYESYLRIAEKYGLPILLTAPTWRLDHERIGDAGVSRGINSDAVDFMVSLKEEFSPTVPVVVGALVGPRNDCYRADLALSSDESYRFHSAQLNELVNSKADLILAQTMPAVSEAHGIARLCSELDHPYVLSFCTGVDGRVLDGKALNEAFCEIDEDENVVRRPEGYFVNCTHPNFHLGSYDPGQLGRLIGIQANGSSKDVCDLDGKSETVADDLKSWSEAMGLFHRDYDVKVLGGCCGTSAQHLEALADLPSIV